MRRLLALLVFRILASSACKPAPVPSTGRIVLTRGESPVGGGRAYTVEVHPDGRVLYEGVTRVRVKGKTGWSIARADAEALFARAARADASAWKPRYDIGTDDLRATVTIDLGGGSAPVVVENNAGCPPSPMLVDQAPAALCDLEQAIDTTARTKTYTE